MRNSDRQRRARTDSILRAFDPRAVITARRSWSQPPAPRLIAELWAEAPAAAAEAAVTTPLAKSAKQHYTRQHQRRRGSLLERSLHDPISASAGSPARLPACFHPQRRLARRRRRAGRPSRSRQGRRNADHRGRRRRRAAGHRPGPAAETRRPGAAEIRARLFDRSALGGRQGQGRQARPGRRFRAPARLLPRQAGDGVAAEPGRQGGADRRGRAQGL